MKPIFSANLVRELRGSPLTVLIALLILQQTGQSVVTAIMLKEITGYKDHAITDALRLLENPTLQLIRRVTGGWKLSTGFDELSTAFQLPLVFEPENRVKRDSPPSSSSGSINLIDSNDSELLLPESGENRDKCDFDENHEAAIKAGIRDPKAAHLAAMPHVTPELIRGHIAAAQSQGMVIGAAIYRIEHNWPVPQEIIDLANANDKVAAITGHEPGCKCPDCTFSRAGAPLCPDCGHYYCTCEEDHEQASE